MSPDFKMKVRTRNSAHLWPRPRVRPLGTGKAKPLASQLHRSAAPRFDGLAVLVHLAKDHLPAGSLQHAGDGNLDGPANHLSSMINNHHGSVVQVAHALVVLLAL